MPSLPPTTQGRIARTLSFIGEHQGKMAVGVSAGAAAAAYARTGDATEAAKAAAPGALAMAAPALERVGAHIADFGIGLAGAAVKATPSVLGVPITNEVTSILGLAGVGAAAGGKLMQGVGIVARRAALPISLGVAAWQIGKAGYEGGTKAALKETGRQALGIATFGMSELAIAGHDIYKSRVAARQAGTSVAGASKTMDGFKQANAHFDHNTMGHADRQAGPAEFERTYKTGAKAGLTETVINTRRAQG